MKQKQRWKVLLLATGFVFSTVLGPSFLRFARAATPGQVVLNEVAWAGSADSPTDEWIELYNNSNESVDLANWHIVDDNGASDYRILSGSIAAHGYFLIEDHESAVSNVTADAIIDLSLANTGDSLQLFDGAGELIDTVNGGGGSWYAGNSSQYASMERIDSSSAVDAAANWAASTGSGFQSSGGSAIIGTPKALNSQTVGNPGGQQTPAVVLSPGSSTVRPGDVLTLTARVQDVQDILVYGFELTYDPAVLQYKSSLEKSFLSEDGTVSTTFQSGLQDGQAGTLLVAGARTVQPQSGVSGTGDIFELQFDVLSVGTATVDFLPGSFLASSAGDVPSQFNGFDLTVVQQQPDAVTNFVAVAGMQRYSIQLSWNAVAGAEKYRVYRRDPHGQMKLLGETVQTVYADGDGVTNGGFIIPDNNYVYAVTAVQGLDESLQTETVGKELRGLKGDNNRTDRVDGRDLEALAKHFAQDDAVTGFDPLIDTTYDGRIDGSDLIDFGVNFAHTYQF